MSDDGITSALVTASLMNSANAATMERASLEQRAQTLSDMYGSKPPAFEEYRQQTGKKTSIGKMLLSAVAGATLAAGAVALVLGAAPAMLGTLVIAGIAGAVLGGSMSAESDHNHALKDYNNFVSDFATNARNQHEARLRQQTIAAVREAAAGNGTNWAATVDQQRGQAKSGGIA